MERIEKLLTSGTQAHYQTAEGSGWLPALPLPYYSWPSRLRDAWAVLTGQAAAVQWPHHRKGRAPAPAQETER